MSSQATTDNRVPDETPKPAAWWRSPAVWIGFIISGLAIAMFVALFDLRKVGRLLLTVSWAHVALSVVIFAAAFMVRSFRWRMLLMPMAKLPFGKVRDVLIVGYMVNLLLPARIGEVARALALWKVAGTSRRATLTTIGMARLFDGCLLLLLLLLIGALFELPAWTRNLTSVFFVFMGTVLVVAVWLAFAERSFFVVMDRVLFFVPARARAAVVGFFRRFAAGTHVLREPKLVLGCGTATVLVWILEFFVYFTMMRGFAIDLPPWAALLAMVVTNIGIAAPSAPGYVGVYEAACSSAVIAMGLDKELALSYAIGVHLMMYTFLVVTGQVLMWRLGLKLTDITGRSGNSPAESA